jgi:hypothetical protein
MTLATEGNRVYQFDHCLTGEREMFAHEGGLFVVYDHGKEQSVSIDPIGMTADEVARAVTVADTILARAPVNRLQRRALQ